MVSLKYPFNEIRLVDSIKNDPIPIIQTKNNTLTIKMLINGYN